MPEEICVSMASPKLTFAETTRGIGEGKKIEVGGGEVIRGLVPRLLLASKYSWSRDGLGPDLRLTSCVFCLPVRA
jgi:hypothetical protein